MTNQDWVPEAVGLRRSGLSWAKVAERVGKAEKTVRKYVMPFIEQLESEQQQIEAEEREKEQEPAYDPRELLPVLKVREAVRQEDGTVIEQDRAMRPSELPQNVETTVPLIRFVFHAIRQAMKQNSARPALGIVIGLAGILNLFTLSFALMVPLWGIPLVYLGAFLVWDVVATMILKAKMLRPALTVRVDAYGKRYYWMEKWWNWEAVKFHDGIKQDYKGKRLIYLDASDDVVRVFNAYAAPLPRLDLDPSDDEFEVTTESLADLPSMMKDVKAWVKDEEPNREVFIRQGMMIAVLGGCLFAIYWAWLSLQDVMAK